MGMHVRVPSFGTKKDSQGCRRTKSRIFKPDSRKKNYAREKQAHLCNGLKRPVCNTGRDQLETTTGDARLKSLD